LALRFKSEYSIEPKGARTRVVVFHEIWGLSKYTMDVCKRLSMLGFAAVAPNLYKGYDELLTPSIVRQAMDVVWDLSLEERRDKTKVDAILARKKPSSAVTDALTTLYDPRFREQLLATATELVERSDARFGGVSTLGFSFGGGISLRVATRTKRLSSAIAYCGEPPEDVSRISCPTLAVYADEDKFMNRSVPGFFEAATRAGIDLTLKTLPRANHEFFDHTKKATYNRAAAEEAWGITSWFLERTLGAQIRTRESLRV